MELCPKMWWCCKVWWGKVPLLQPWGSVPLLLLLPRLPIVWMLPRDEPRPRHASEKTD